MKKNTTLLRRMLCLALVAVMAIGLVGCFGEANPPAGTTGSTTAKPGPQHPGDVVDAVYANGAAIEGAGATLEEGSFALTSPTPDEANAIEKTAAQFINMFRAGGPEEGKTYKITDGKPVSFSSSGRSYNCGNILLIAPAGVIFDGAYEVEFNGMTVIGPVSVKGSDAMTFNNLGVLNPNGAAVTVDAESENVIFDGCRLNGATALANAGKSLTVVNSAVISTAAGIADAAEQGTVVMNNAFSGAGTAIATTASDCYIRGNSFDLSAASVGISVTGTPVNGLIALNDIKGAQTGVSLKGVTNFSVVRNSFVTVICEENTSIYVCDNEMGGRLRAQKNNYFLADGNTVPSDGLDHSTLQADNTGTNGDTLTDVDARLEVGANEELLPHTNKDLFLEMERKETVFDGHIDSGLALNDYIEEVAKNSPYVIVAPGAYTVLDEADITSAQSNTTVYAYGALMERARKSTLPLGRMFDIDKQADKFTIKGLVIGFERQSCGQVYVLAKEQKNGRNILLCITGAGMDNEFGNTNKTLYDVTGMGAQRMNTFYAYCDTGFNRIQKLSNGLMEMEVSSSVYEMILEGDILTCRSQQAGTTLTVYNSTDITFKDMTIYGNSGGFASVEGNNRTATTYYRLHNTTKSGPIIDKATYDRYKALEEQYGVNLEVSVDELGRYRGSLPHIGSIDATHTTGCAQGSVVVSCIFENMCDDATNQNHTHARVDELIDNGDGTTTIVYKGNYSEYSYGQYSSGEGGYCRQFVEGDRVYVYTAAGQLVCDTPALSVTNKYMVKQGNIMVQKRVLNVQRMERCRSQEGKSTMAESNFYTSFYYVTVATKDVNFDAVAGLDMTDNNWQSDNKVLIDNMSMASNGFIFDNVLSQNIRSRGLLIKASEGKILNCTFRNIGMSCAAILYEIYWGESGVSENLEVARNLMDHTGYFAYNQYYGTSSWDTYNRRYSPIAIEGLGSRVDEDFLLYKNITITDNVIMNRTTEYAVYVNSARDVIITNNVFGTHVDGESEERPSRGVFINGGMNIKIEGNTYSSLDLPIEENIHAQHNKNVYGGDVEYEGNKVIPDSE